MDNPKRIEMPTHSRLLLRESEARLTAAELNDSPWGRTGVARVLQNRLGIELQTGGFAGTICLHDDLLVEIKELVPGTVATCLPLAHRFSRTARQSLGSARTAVSAPVALAMQYLDAARELLRKGGAKQYFTVAEPSSRLRGRPLLAQSITRLWARGQVDKIYQRTRALTLDTPPNRVLLAAAIRAERLVSGRDEEQYAKLARELQRIFAGVSQWSLEDLQSTANQEADLTVLGLARTLLKGVPYLPREFQGEVSNAWVNVDQLFEAAVRSVLADAIGQHAVRRGAGLGAKVLQPHTTRGGLNKRADPDIVIGMGEEKIVADAKYRRGQNSISEGPLYQLLSHSMAFDASRAALIAPALNGQIGVTCLGIDPVGRQIDLVLVDPSSNDGLVGPLQTWASELKVQYLGVG